MVPSAAQAFSRLKRKHLEHGEFVLVAKESSALLSTPSNRGGRGGFGGGRGFNGRGARGNYGFGRGNRRGFGGRRGRGDRYDGTDERKCTHCGNDGHTEPFCWDKHGKPAYAHNVYDQTFGSSTAAPSIASNPSTTEVLGQILNRLNCILPTIAYKFFLKNIFGSLCYVFILYIIYGENTGVVNNSKTIATQGCYAELKVPGTTQLVLVLMQAILAFSSS
ncbi:hypothetical protein IFM89_012312 [Coptis chinensis]|uniref:CCHC-type domain-containing protein n=1 Tax=Coptis chinensis TaxID=261450 RepID=A0A835HB05_9MAGN|nr:hypothetical protein IFM89_012312 [Coptis chinensis]